MLLPGWFHLGRWAPPPSCTRRPCLLLRWCREESLWQNSTWKTHPLPCTSGVFGDYYTHTHLGWNALTFALPLLQVPLPGPLWDHAAPGPGSPRDGDGHRLTARHSQTVRHASEVKARNLQKFARFGRFATEIWGKQGTFLWPRALSLHLSQQFLLLSFHFYKINVTENDMKKLQFLKRVKKLTEIVIFHILMYCAYVTVGGSV